MNTVTGPTSDASEPVTTSENSPDTLPLTGYTVDQLKNFIKRQLGFPVWNVELTDQQILDHIQGALQQFSIWCPLTRVGNVVLVKGQSRYLSEVDIGQGIAKIEFVEPNPVPTEIFYMAT